MFDFTNLAKPVIKQFIIQADRTTIKPQVIKPQPKYKRSPNGQSKQPITKKPQGPKPTSMCIHCKLMFSPNMLKRWHGDNCKMKPLELYNSLIIKNIIKQHISAIH
jgi:hypothetical protein